MNLYLFGNCQVSTLRRMILEDHPGWQVTSLDVSAIEVADRATETRHLAAILDADVIVSQPVAAWRGSPVLSLDTVRAAKRDSTQLIVFPSIVFEGTHAAFTYLGNRLGGHRMPYHNSHTLDMYLHGYRPQDIAVLQASRDFYTPAFVETGIAASLAELRAREHAHGATIHVSALIEERCRSAILMHTVNHPRRPLFACVLNAIYAALSEPRCASESGADYLAFPTIPPLPTVLAHLGLADSAPWFASVGWQASREEYVLGSLAYYARLIRRELLRSLQQSRGQEFLDAFHGRVPRLEGMAGPGGSVMASDVITSVFSVLLGREPHPHERDEHLAHITLMGVEKWLRVVAESEECRNRRTMPDGTHPGQVGF